jgi:hypothetical protein
MKAKQLTILVLAALVLGGGGLLVTKNRQSEFADSKTNVGGPLLGAFDLNTVSGLRLSQGSNVVNVVKSGDDWVVKERGGYPANFEEVRGLVRKLAELKVIQPVKVGVSRLPLLELTKDSGILVELVDQAGKQLKSITLGKQITAGGGDGSPFGSGGMPSGRYVQTGPGPESVVVVNDPLSAAKTDAAEWVSKDFFKVEQPVSVVVVGTSPTNSFTLTRTNEFADWTLAALEAGEQLDKNKLWSFNSLLSAPSFNDLVLAPDLVKLGLDRPTKAIIKTAAGFTYEVKLGQPEGEDYPFQFSVTAELKRQREPGKDEKPEDKTKLDKEFADKLAQQEQKLKAEQALAPWTYTVSKWTVEALLKGRPELLADKKAAEGLPSPASAAETLGIELPTVPGKP